MRVALIYFGRRGGGPVYSLEIAKNLKDKADLFCFISSGIENLRYWRKYQIPFLAIPTYKNKIGFSLSFFNLAKFLKIRRKIKKFNPDVIYYPFFHPWDVVINLLFPKLPKVFTVHDPIFHKGEENFILEFLQNLAIKQAERIVILSRAFFQEIIKKGKSAKDIDVIPHGIFDYYSKLMTQPLKDLEEEPPTILFFGRIEKYKGLSDLLRAFPKIKNEVPDVKLKIVGEGDLGPYKKEIRMLEKKYEDDIEIRNEWIKDNEIGKVFWMKGLSCSPYVEASQSGVIPTAYAYKIPVVATKIGGLEEQVKDGETGRLVSPNNQEELASACIEILKNPEKRKRMGIEGYKMAKEKWNWEIISQKVLKSLKKACAV